MLGEDIGPSTLDRVSWRLISALRLDQVHLAHCLEVTHCILLNIPLGALVKNARCAACVHGDLLHSSSSTDLYWHVVQLGQVYQSS